MARVQRHDKRHDTGMQLSAVAIKLHPTIMEGDEQIANHGNGSIDNHRNNTPEPLRP